MTGIRIPVDGLDFRFIETKMFAVYYWNPTEDLNNSMSTAGSIISESKVPRI